MPTPVFELEAVGFRRDGRDILATIGWRVDPGSRWAILGPNGCGKSTLLGLITGSLWPTSGTIRREGEELVDLPTFGRRIGLVNEFVAARIPDDEPVADTVLSGRFAQLGLTLFPGMEITADDHGHARNGLDCVGCSHLADRPFGVLSQGERQRVAVARALAAEPACLVLDEPCAALDPGARERFLGWLGDFLRREADPAVILVTHHVEEILPEFDRTLVLAAGSVLAAGPTTEVPTQPTFEALYDTRLERLERVGGRHWPVWGRP